jgi:ribosomal protein S18 acetylase RimI-like enzyme
MLHCDPTRIAARRMYESTGFVEAQRLRAYYGDGRDALLMKLSNEGRDAVRADVEAQPPGQWM